MKLPYREVNTEKDLRLLLNISLNTRIKKHPLLKNTKQSWPVPLVKLGYSTSIKYNEKKEQSRLEYRLFKEKPKQLKLWKERENQRIKRSP